MPSIAMEHVWFDSAPNSLEPATKKQKSEENVTPTALTYRVASIANLIHHAPALPAASSAAPEARPSTPEHLPTSSTPPSVEASSHRSPSHPDLRRTLIESRHRMLSANEIRDLILAELHFQERPNTGTPDWAIYKECPKQRRRAKKSDRWANSGGMRGSRDLPYNSPKPFIRRRYGSVFTHGEPSSKGKRYYEYTLLRTKEDGTIEEDKRCNLFHILPRPGETDRGRRVAPTAINGASNVGLKRPPSPPAAKARMLHRLPQLLMSVPAPPTAVVSNTIAKMAHPTATEVKCQLSDAHKQSSLRQDELSMLSAVSALTDLLEGEAR